MKENLILQTFDWKESNDTITEYDDGNEIEIQKYVIKAYGRTEDNKSVYLKINNYKPYFYIKKPDYWNNDNIKSYINYIKNEVYKNVLNEFYEYEITEHCDLIGFTNYKKFEFIKLSFLSMRAFYAFKRVIKEGEINNKRILKKDYKIQIYESKIKPFLDFIHEKDLKTCGWLKVLKYKKIKGIELTYCDINIHCDYIDIVNHEETKMTKQIVASFDIECYSESGMFPNASNPNDYITQIGTVFCYYGETEPFYSNIITLEGCEKIKGMENVDIKSCNTERKVLKSWTKLIQKMDPDYIVGFNINGFDFKYMHDRAEKLNILNDFSLLDRNKRQKTKYMDGSDKKNKMGSSKAFGENELYYFDFDGRVLIDVFTNIKRNIALDCYKLDFIASTYIKEKIINYSNENNICKIKTNSIYGISEDQYITISYFDGLTTNTHNQKYQITKIEDIGEKEKIITVNGIIPEDIRQFKKLCWCHAKDDVTAKDMFRLQKGSDYDRGIIAKYCIMDCILVIKIMEKLQILNNNIGMANVCFVPLSFIFMRGQSIKGQSLLSKVCKNENHLIPDIEPPENYGNEEDKDKYEGAIVFTPKFVKLYTTPVIVLDYSSLYPNTAICYNISHETLILDKKYMDLEEYKYNKINFDVNGKEQVWYYAERKDGTKGIIPRILDGLLKKRKSVKKEMESCKDPFLAKILDGLQLAYKMTANSIYGLLGAKVSPIYLAPLAPSITAGGRGMLKYARQFINKPFNQLLNLCLSNQKKEYKKFSKEYFEKFPEHRFEGNNRYNNKKEFIKYFRKRVSEIVEHIDDKENLKVNPDVVYGDSVVKDTPILLMDNNNIFIETIENIGKKFSSYENFKPYERGLKNKEMDDSINLKVWTSNGWSNIKKVIRHKTNKKIYEVLTHTGCVRVTEDHSLLDENLNEIKPKDCKVGKELFHKYPKLENNINNFDDINKAYIYGFFFGDGSCGKYNTNSSGIKYSWALNNSDINLINILLDKLKIIYPNDKFKYIDTIKSSGVYKIIPCCENIKKFVEEYRNIFYDKDKLKIIPKEILNSTKIIKENFLKGYYDADGCRSDTNKTNCHRCDIKGQISASNLYYLLKSIGYNVSINKRKDKMEIFRLTFSKNNLRKSSNIIKKINEIGYINDYVYDLETETGNFQAGVGSLIVKNTDSVFFVMNYNMEISDLLMTSINFGQLSGETICKTLPEPEKMVYEKTMFRFIQLAKKKYVGNLYEDDDINFFQKNMGIVLKRRDNAKIVKIVVGGIVDHMLNKNENSEIIKYVRTVLKNILRGKYPIEYFIISKTLKKNYKNRSSIAHAVLADRIAKRDPGNKPQVNDRIQYVYFISNKKTKLQGDKIEDPKYLLDNNLELDYLYYITNQIEKPALQFLELIVENPKTIFQNAIDSETKRRKGQTSIDKLMSKYDNEEINNEEDIENSLSSNTLSFNDEDIKTIKNKKFTITF